MLKITRNRAEAKRTEEAKPVRVPSATSKCSTNSRSIASRICRNAPPAQSKIPKRDVLGSNTKKAIVTIRSIPRPILKPASKPTEEKKSSRSTISLAAPKVTTRANSAASIRSNLHTKRSASSRETTRSEIGVPLSEKFQKAAERVAAKKNILAFKSIKEKVRSLQAEFMKKYEAIKNEVHPDDGEYKLFEVVKKDDGLLVAKIEQKLKIGCPHRLDQFKMDMHDYIQNHSLGLLNQLQVGDSSKGQDLLEKDKENELSLLDDILKQVDSFESYDDPGEKPACMNSELGINVDKLSKEVDELRRNLGQSQKELNKVKKSDEDSGISHKEKLEEKNKKIARKQLEIDEVQKKIESLAKDGLKEKVNNRELQEKLNVKTTQIEELKKKLTTQQSKILEDETKIKKLEIELKAALKDVERRVEIEHTIGDQATKHADEINALKGELSTSRKDGDRLEKELQNLKIEVANFRDLDTELLLLKDNVKQKNAGNFAMRQTIKDLEKKILNNESQIIAAKNANEELIKLQESETEKSQKIDLLEMELFKTNVHIKKIAQKIDMNRKLLRLRSILIESLQTNENKQKICIPPEDLFAEDNERNYDPQMLRSDLITRTAECKNLLATLSCKQLELAQQEHTIKLLKENNERAHTLHALQDTKIGRLEEELTGLKQTIAMYQHVVLPNAVQMKKSKK